MKMTFLLSAALLGTLSLACAVQAQYMSGQQNAQSASTSASPGTSTNAARGTSEYGGVSGGTSATGQLNRSGWAPCGHLPQCSPDSGH